MDEDDELETAMLDPDQDLTRGARGRVGPVRGAPWWRGARATKEEAASSIDDERCSLNLLFPVRYISSTMVART